MAFSVAELVKKLESLPADEREALEKKLLADYARQAAFGRPVGIAGRSRVFAVVTDLEELSLAEDADVVSVATHDEFARAVADEGVHLILVRGGAEVKEADIFAGLKDSGLDQAVFVVRS